MRGASTLRRGRRRRAEGKSSAGVSPPPGVLQKSPQAIENKEDEGEKELQEKPRACKLLKKIELQKKRDTESTEFGARRPQRMTSPGVIEGRMRIFR